MTTFHPLHTSLPLPDKFTYPFCYEPHPLALEACRQLQRYIAAQTQWAEELQQGKMFGVLVVERTDGTIGFLAAYSGLLAGSNRLDYFVPAVYDLLQPDGHFKQGEERISALNRRISQLSQSSERTRLAQQLAESREAWDKRTEAWRRKMDEAKRQRDKRRTEGSPSEEEREEMTRQSQFMKAELKRMKQAAQAESHALEEQLVRMDGETARLKQERKQMSDNLQRWIFDQYRLFKARGEVSTVSDIFYREMHATPPSGAGECCAPKLLRWAYARHMRSLCMAEFWWGRSPKTEVRHHLHFYPACRSKCKPLLGHMLQGLDVAPNPLATDPHALQPRVMYEDEWLAVVSKPHGMLSVPGKDGRRSVLTWAQAMWPQAEGPLIVHRLDMDTSGLMVIAKTQESHKRLQAEFLDRDIKKRYMAVLSGTLAPEVKREGTIILPLRPDLDDRPRQLVDPIHGKRAITSYRVVDDKNGETLIALYPHTARTHPLRMHRARPEGLSCPSWGDSLDGHPADRLWLHAEELQFRHPMTGKTIIVKDPFSSQQLGK